jgi:CheY-like chemotaxis protein
MSRILLVDDSPHAQRMGERILTEEGYEVVTVSNADTALIRLDDVDPDVIIADTVMPGRTGYEICHYIKMSPKHHHAKVVLTAGVLEPFDEEQTRRAEADGTLKKPFEASALLATVKPLAEAASAARAARQPAAPAAAAAKPAPAAPFVAVVDAEQIRAAVTVALDASMESMVEEIARRVLDTLQTRKPAAAAPSPASALDSPPLAALQPEPPLPAVPPAALPRVQTVRRVSPLRIRSGSILGLDIGRPEAPPPSPEPADPDPAGPEPE